jgi:deazaflavin-dependent oxidoreductase (nitroreductase family)
MKKALLRRGLAPAALTVKSHWFLKLTVAAFVAQSGWPRRLDSSQYEPMATHYQRPGWFTKHVFNRIVAGLTRLGVSLVGSRVLEVRGRKSGEWRRTPVNPLEFEGERYIVAPRGETQWVRNLRASGEGRLRKGFRTEEFTATELPDEEKLPLLRAYLKKWAWEVGAFFQGVGADAPDDELRRIAPLHPVFRISGGHKASP